jgi:hypothetical protein
MEVQLAFFGDYIQACGPLDESVNNRIIELINVFLMLNDIDFDTALEIGDFKLWLRSCEVPPRVVAQLSVKKEKHA